MFGHNDLAAGVAGLARLQTTANLFHAMPSTVPVAVPIACGWAMNRGAGERFLWRDLFLAGLRTYVRVARFVRVSASDAPAWAG